MSEEHVGQMLFPGTHHVSMPVTIGSTVCHVGHKVRKANEFKFEVLNKKLLLMML